MATTPLFVQSLGGTAEFHKRLGGWRDISLCIYAQGDIFVYIMQNRKMLEGIKEVLGVPASIHWDSPNNTINVGQHHHGEGPSTLCIRDANALPVLDILITHSPEFHVQVGGREEAEVEQDGNFIDGLAGTDAYASICVSAALQPNSY
jgi:hypothetical protein